MGQVYSFRLPVAILVLMKRRRFIKGLGISSAALAATPGYGRGEIPAPPGIADYSYGGIHTMQDILSAEGLAVIRLETEGPPGEKMALQDGQPVIRNAEIVRAREYFLGKVKVLWLKDAAEDTRLIIPGEKRWQLTLGELLQQKEITGSVNGAAIRANFLLDREIGEITPGDFGASDPDGDFSFVAMADPQGGLPDDADGLKTRMKIHNAFIRESVDLVNRLDFDPLFTMVIGDVCDDWGYEKDLAQMNAFLSRLKTPVLYGIGNHETLLRSEFGPGYNMDAFNNFLGAQISMNGIDKLLYSFNAGAWHFVVWPDPLRDHFWETHPHYFDWLERDLEKHKERPTMVFQHVPVHPAGISPLINYAEPVCVKRTFLEILARHGNVKVVLSGHVHIHLKASFKTAVSWRGIRLINLPAAGYRPRAFGEADFYGGPTQGVALVHIRGNEADIQFKTVTEELFTFPAQLPAFEEGSFPLWLKYKWELPACNEITNGDFRNGLEGWSGRYVYTEDENPSNLRKVRPAPDMPGRSCLYLYCRRRGYMAPGQDRLPQDINRICQPVLVRKSARPFLWFSYRIDGASTDPEGYAGGYAWVEGFSGAVKVLNIMYSAGKIWVNIGGKYSHHREVPYIQMGLPGEPDTWHRAALDIAGDYENGNRDRSYTDLGVDRLVVNLGVWNINDGEQQPFGICFTGLSLEYDLDVPGNTGGRTVRPKPIEDQWWRNKVWPWKHIAGEHRYVIATRPPEEG